MQDKEERPVSLEGEWLMVGGNKIHKTCVISDNVVMGTGNVFYPYAVIGVPGFIRNSENANGKIIIGDNNWFGAHVSVMSGESGETVIGDENLVMNYVNIGHDVSLGSNNEIGVRTVLAGWSTVGDYNKIKLSCTVRNRARIGSRNIVGMGSLVTKPFDVDDKVIYGSPARIIRNTEKRSV